MNYAADSPPTVKMLSKICQLQLRVRMLEQCIRNAGGVVPPNRGMVAYHLLANAEEYSGDETRSPAKKARVMTAC